MGVNNLIWVVFSQHLSGIVSAIHCIFLKCGDDGALARSVYIAFQFQENKTLDDSIMHEIFAQSTSFLRPTRARQALTR